jgi:hypothetical protein
MTQIIHIAEKSMTGLFGHYADVTSRLCAAFSKKQTFPIVFCNTQSDEICRDYFYLRNIELRSQLETSSLRPLEKLLARPLGLSRYKALRRTLFPSYKGLPAGQLFEAPLFVPSAEMSDVISALKYQKSCKTLLGFWGSPTNETKNALQLLNKTLSHYNTEKVVLGAYDDFTFEELLRLKHVVNVVRLPTPYDSENGNETRDQNKFPSIGFAGWMREERGKELLIQIQNECRKLNYNVIDARSEVKRDSVTYSNGHSYEKPLGETLRLCDVVVWPSHAERYAQRTSGIVFHCIANGVPVIVPENTLPAKILQNYELTNARITEHSVTGVMSAIKNNLTDLQKNKNNTQNAKAKFSEVEGTDNLIDECLRLLE